MDVSKSSKSRSFSPAEGAMGCSCKRKNLAPNLRLSKSINLQIIIQIQFPQSHFGLFNFL